jgi:hypothetical protein
MENQYFIKKNENGNYVIANKEGKPLFGLTCSLKNPCKKCKKCIKPIKTPVMKSLKSVNKVLLDKVLIGISLAIGISIFIVILYKRLKSTKSIKKPNCNSKLLEEFRKLSKPPEDM